MSDYLVTDTELTSVANAIRTKGGTSADLSFPTGFVQAINDIPTGSEPTGTKYIYTDIDDLDQVYDVSNYQYCSVDFAPVKDEKHRIWIELTSDDLTFQAPIGTMWFSKYTGKINWGDGSPIVDFDGNNYSQTHSYPKAGRYCVEVWWTGGTKTTYFHPKNADINKVIAVEIFAKYSNVDDYANMPNLRKVRYSFNPIKVSFNNCPKLTDIVIPNSANEIVTASDCTSLEYLTIPSSIVSISAYTFKNNTSMKEYHFLGTTPPSISDATFQGIPSTCKIYVPSASLNAYKTATNWSTYASQIVGE